ncbi:hypothetical protein, partial [Muribaculum intestinale]
MGKNEKGPAKTNAARLLDKAG